jgi:prepilin-type N-terminal cleavage/methylation domain-containing protein
MNPKQEESKMKNKEQLRGFSLLELVMVMIIIAIGSALFVAGMNDTMPKRRLGNDTSELSHSLLTAKMLAVGTHIPHGVLIWREGTSPDFTYFYYVFKDANSDNAFTDSDSNKRKQCEFAGGSCTAGGEDPIVGTIHQLDSNNAVISIFGTTMSSGSTSGVVIFSALGNVSTALGGDIVIQSKTLQFKDNPTAPYTKSYAGGVRVDLSSGNNSTIPPTPRTWNCPS